MDKRLSNPETAMAADDRHLSHFWQTETVLKAEAASMAELREAVRRTELWALVADGLLIAAQNDVRTAHANLAAARAALMEAEEMKRGEA